MENPLDLSEAEVAGGKLTVESTDMGGYEGQRLLFNGQPVTGIEESYVSIEGVVPANDEDWVIVSVSGGGNGCPMNWAIVATSDADARPTEVFGTCSEGFLNLRRDGNGIAFEIPSFSDGEVDESYFYDGTLTLR